MKRVEGAGGFDVGATLWTRLAAMRHGCLAAHRDACWVLSLFVTFYHPPSLCLSSQWIMPFTVMLVLIPNVVVAYVVAVSSGLSVAASLLLPW